LHPFFQGSARWDVRSMHDTPSIAAILAHLTTYC
jgi:hypothetical protein